MEIWIKDRGLLVLTQDSLHIAGDQSKANAPISMGQLINHRAWLGSQIVQLKAQIPSVEKLSKRTPPKTLIAELAKVKAAKELLPKLQAQLVDMEAEYLSLHGKPTWHPINESTKQ